MKTKGTRQTQIYNTEHGCPRLVKGYERRSNIINSQIESTNCIIGYQNIDLPSKTHTPKRRLVLIHRLLSSLIAAEALV